MSTYIDELESMSKRQLMVLLARQHHEETQGVAVVGIGCRFAGGIEGPRAFWAALREGTVVPMRSADGPRDSRGEPRWNLDAPDLAPCAALLRTGAYLADVDRFDAAYFGISEEEALQIDPQQRLLLEVTLQALADANLTRERLRGLRVGIFACTGAVEYTFASLRNRHPLGEASAFLASGASISAASGRLGWALGVSGPAVSLDTASSSALVAVHLATQSLRSRECDVALVGASNLVLSPVSTVGLAKAGMLSPSGRSLPFAAGADGHVRAEGCAAVVLRRNDDAVKAGEPRYAVVRGSAVHQHGARLGLAVASASGQKAVIHEALRSARLAPHDVQYVEAQANGSSLGAAIEFESIAAAFDRRSPGAPPLFVGSCKANIGYLENASGIAGFVKAALCLAHREIPVQVGADKPDPAIPWQETALRCPKATTPWPASSPRRIAGVNAIGFTGVGAHVVLEGAAGAADTPPEAGATPVLLALSAHEPEALARTAARLHADLAARPDWDHVRVCHTLASGRDCLAVRHAAVVRSRAELLGALDGLARGGTPAATPRRRAALVLDLSVPSGPQLRAALDASREPGFEALEAHLRARAARMRISEALGASTDAEPPRGASLAWALAWLDLAAATGFTIAGATFAGPHRGLLACALVAEGGADAVCDRWVEGRVGDAPTAAAGWDVTDDGATLTLRGPDHGDARVVRSAELDPAGWIERVAEAFRGGAPVRPSGLFARKASWMCRLPGPALTGKRYWPDNNTWT